MKWFCVLLLTLTLTTFAQNPGDIIITEIMQNPDAVTDVNGEWFEIYNTTISDINIDGWTIKDDGSNSHLIDNGGTLTVPAGGFLILARNSNSSTNGGISANYQYSGFQLTNTGDEIVLVAPNNTEIDRVNYDGGPNFPTPTGASMILSDFSVDNNLGSNWATATAREANFTGSTTDLGSPGTLGTGQKISNDTNHPETSLTFAAATSAEGSFSDNDAGGGIIGVEIKAITDMTIQLPKSTGAILSNVGDMFTTSATPSVTFKVVAMGSAPSISVVITDFARNRTVWIYRFFP